MIGILGASSGFNTNYTFYYDRKKMKRLFIAINLPGSIKEAFTKWRDLHKNFFVRWTKKESLHITLYFIGWVEETKIRGISESLKTVVLGHKPFDIYLIEITVGPDEKNPRMIWVNGPTTNELLKLHKEIAEKIEKIVDRTEMLPFKNHVTLARKDGRIRPFNEETDLKFQVKSFELMESKLLRDGAEYGIIENFILE